MPTLMMDVVCYYLGSVNSTNAKAGGLGGVLRSMPAILPYCNEKYVTLQSLESLWGYALFHEAILKVLVSCGNSIAKVAFTSLVFIFK